MGKIYIYKYITKSTDIKKSAFHKNQLKVDHRFEWKMLNYKILRGKFLLFGIKQIVLSYNTKSMLHFFKK